MKGQVTGIYFFCFTSRDPTHWTTGFSRPGRCYVSVVRYWLPEARPRQDPFRDRDNTVETVALIGGEWTKEWTC